MILVDSGPLIALFDPSDRRHRRSRSTFEKVTEELVTTTPVLTEVSHLLGPASFGFRRLAQLVTAGGLQVDFLAASTLARCFELMEQYGDQEMDLADASLVAISESLAASTIWTFDESDFAVFRTRRGHRYLPFEIVR